MLVKLDLQFILSSGRGPFSPNMVDPRVACSMRTQFRGHWVALTVAVMAFSALSLQRSLAATSISQSISALKQIRLGTRRYHPELSL